MVSFPHQLNLNAGLSQLQKRAMTAHQASTRSYVDSAERYSVHGFKFELNLLVLQKVYSTFRTNPPACSVAPRTQYVKSANALISREALPL